METTSAGTVDDRFPVQTLYHSCLSYLRQNHMLINFTILSKDIGDDLIKIILDCDHLKKFKISPYRIIKTWNFESYIYKYCPEKMHEFAQTDDLSQCVSNWYDYKYKIYWWELFKLYPNNNFHRNSKGYTKIFFEEYFNRYPGLADWAETLGYISKKLWIPENLVEDLI